MHTHTPQYAPPQFYNTLPVNLLREKSKYRRYMYPAGISVSHLGFRLQVPVLLSPGLLAERPDFRCEPPLRRKIREE